MAGKKKLLLLKYTPLDALSLCLGHKRNEKNKALEQKMLLEQNYGIEIHAVQKRNPFHGRFTAVSRKFFLDFGVQT